MELVDGQLELCAGGEGVYSAADYLTKRIAIALLASSESDDLAREEVLVHFKTFLDDIFRINSGDEILFKFDSLLKDLQGSYLDDLLGPLRNLRVVLGNLPRSNNDLDFGNMLRSVIKAYFLMEGLEERRREYVDAYVSGFYSRIMKGEEIAEEGRYKLDMLAWYVDMGMKFITPPIVERLDGLDRKSARMLASDLKKHLDAFDRDKVTLFWLDNSMSSTQSLISRLGFWEDETGRIRVKHSLDAVYLKDGGHDVNPAVLPTKEKVRVNWELPSLFCHADGLINADGNFLFDLGKFLDRIEEWLKVGVDKRKEMINRDMFAMMDKAAQENLGRSLQGAHVDDGLHTIRLNRTILS